MFCNTSTKYPWPPYVLAEHPIPKLYCFNIEVATALECNRFYFLLDFECCLGISAYLATGTFVRLDEKAGARSLHSNSIQRLC